MNPRRFAAPDAGAALAAAWRQPAGAPPVEIVGPVPWPVPAEVSLRSVTGGPVEAPLGPVPVDLPALPRAAVPAWPAAPAPADQVATALAWLWAEGGPALEVWDRAPVAPFTDLAAHLPDEGVRLCWRLPPGSHPPVDWLEAVSRRRAPLKLILDLADAPPAGPWADGWWIVASGDAAEVSAILAQHLRDEFPVLILLASPVPSTWPRDQAWEPGQGRWLRSAPGPVTVCTAATALAVLAQAGAVWQATSLRPVAPLPSGARRVLGAWAEGLGLDGQPLADGGGAIAGGGA